MTTTTAREIHPTDVVTYCGLTFTARSVQFDVDLVKVVPFEPGICVQYIWEEREVEISRRRSRDDRPYVVLTRRYLKSGYCIKGRRTFKTRAAQSRFIGRTTAAVTYFN